MPNELFYVFIETRPILRHLGEFEKNRLISRVNTRFLSKGDRNGLSKRAALASFHFFCVEINYI
jgi:hypothetical protein